MGLSKYNFILKTSSVSIFKKEDLVKCFFGELEKLTHSIKSDWLYPGTYNRKREISCVNSLES